MSEYVIRASFTETTVRVYQAYSEAIAKPALERGKFVSPFSMSRMTWIKPSFNWMMYRSGYGTKVGQEVVLAIDIAREGFEWALRHAVLSHFESGIHSSVEEWSKCLQASSVRVQWDPERNWRLGILENVRAIQIGLAYEAVDRYVNDWIRRIEDVTPIARQIAADRHAGVSPQFLPSQLEKPYLLTRELSEFLAKTIIPVAKHPIQRSLD